MPHLIYPLGSVSPRSSDTILLGFFGSRDIRAAPVRASLSFRPVVLINFSMIDQDLLHVA